MIASAVLYLLLGVYHSQEVLEGPVEYSANRPAIGRSIPAFSLPNTDHKRVFVVGKQDRPTVLFFFCGCEKCFALAKAWGMARKSGKDTNSLLAKHTPRTVVVYTELSAENAETIARMSDLSVDSVLLLDQERTVSAYLYHADECPRVFVTDRSGRLCYTNSASDTLSPEGKLTRVIDNIVSTLRRVAPLPNSATNKKTNTTRSRIQP